MEVVSTTHHTPLCAERQTLAKFACGTRRLFRRISQSTVEPLLLGKWQATRKAEWVGARRRTNELKVRLVTAKSKLSAAQVLFRSSSKADVGIYLLVCRVSLLFTLPSLSAPRLGVEEL